MNLVAPIGAMALVLLTGLPGCKGGASTKIKDAGPSDEERAQALCQRLVVAGVAKNCGSVDPRMTKTMGGTISVPFELVGGFSQDVGRAEYDPNPDNFKEPDGATGDGSCNPNGGSYCAPADAFPELHAVSTTTRLSVMWTTRPNADPKALVETAWDKCRSIRAPGAPIGRGPVALGNGWSASKTVASCAKLHAKEYATYQALYEAAKKAVATP